MEQNKTDLLNAVISEKSENQLQVVIDKGSEPSSSSLPFYCDALTDENVNSILDDTDSHLVTLIGFSEYGKSTFVASMYHLFMVEGHIGEYKFIDSDTYSGFEKRAYVRNARLNAKRRLSRTTSTEGYYLSLLIEKNNIRKKLIISDRAGESYKNLYTSDIEVVKRDTGLKNSKHLIFFLDTSVLADDSAYLYFRNKFYTLLSRFKQAEVFHNKVIDIIYNKSDFINDNNKATIGKYKHDIESYISKVSNMLINKTFNVTSNNMSDRDNVKTMEEIFMYIFDTCDERAKELNDKIDWVKNI